MPTDTKLLDYTNKQNRVPQPLTKLNYGQKIVYHPYALNFTVFVPELSRLPLKVGSRRLNFFTEARGYLISTPGWFWCILTRCHVGHLQSYDTTPHQAFGHSIAYTNPLERPQVRNLVQRLDYLTPAVERPPPPERISPKKTSKPPWCGWH